MLRTGMWVVGLGCLLVATQAPAGGSAGAAAPGATRADAARYAPVAPVRVLGQVDLGQAELGRLTETEQRNLARLTAEGG